MVRSQRWASHAADERSGNAVDDGDAADDQAGVADRKPGGAVQKLRNPGGDAAHGKGQGGQAEGGGEKGGIA